MFRKFSQWITDTSESVASCCRGCHYLISTGIQASSQDTTIPQQRYAVVALQDDVHKHVFCSAYVSMSTKLIKIRYFVSIYAPEAFGGARDSFLLGHML